VIVIDGNRVDVLNLPHFQLDLLRSLVKKLILKEVSNWMQVQQKTCVRLVEVSEW
jgi:hypothetical protein